MRALFVSRGVITAALLGLILGAGQVSSFAQDETKPSAKSDKKEKVAGRLPPYYSEVVSKEQRTKIYEIQQKFSEQRESTSMEEPFTAMPCGPSFCGGRIY